MITQTRADILVHAPNGWLVAVVEVWNRLELTPEDALIARRTLAEWGGLPPVETGSAGIPELPGDPPPLPPPPTERSPTSLRAPSRRLRAS